MSADVLRVRIDFISDVACPWCAIGLKSLQRALSRLSGEVEAEWHFQPFELNPQLPPEGADATQNLMLKYGRGASEIEAMRATIRQRGAELGFAYNVGPGSRIHNTFDAHRLLHWAGLEGRQTALAEALFGAYFTEGRDVSDPAVLQEVAAGCGLDGARAAQILGSDEYAAEVRTREEFYTTRGIHSVPSILFDQQKMVPGAQPPEMFEQFLRGLIAERAQAAGAVAGAAPPA